MKATYLKSVSFSILLLGLLIIASNATAQTGKVWVSIADFSKLGIIENDGNLNSTNAQVDLLIQSLEISAIEKAVPASRTEGLKKVYEITCNCDEKLLLQETTRLSSIFSKPVIAPKYEVLATPNDYSLVFSNDYALNLINASAAWDISTGDSSIILAISDANFVLNHEELYGKYTYTTPNNANTNYVHGTAVAITAAGSTNNGLGKSSIGYNSSLQLRAMNYNEVLEATYSGAHVINLSWTSGCTENQYTQDIMDEVYNNGTIVVASAGNGSTCGGSTNLVYPAAHNHVISVSSVGPADNHERTIGDPATTHQHNNTVDICAPGYDVALSCGSGWYLTGNGTSFAAPFVTGTIGLILAVNPCLTVDQVEYILKASAHNIDSINPLYAGGLGAGRLDAFAALQLASTFSHLTVSGIKNVNCQTSLQEVTLSIENGVAPFSIEWNTTDTTLTLANLQGGTTYSAIVTDSIGCKVAFEMVADSIQTMAYDAQINNVNCFNENSGSIEVSMIAGEPAYSFLWSNGDTTATIFNLVAGYYNLQITDRFNCTVFDQFFVNQPNQLVSTSQVLSNAKHTEFDIDVTVVGGSFPYSYSWNTGSTNQDLNSLSTGFYEVGIVDAHGCNTSLNFLLTANTVNEFLENEIVIAEDANLNKGQLSLTENSNNQISLYPNPAINTTHIKWDVSLTIESIQVFDMSGKLIQSFDNMLEANVFELQNIESGNYMVQFATSTGEKVVKKITFL